MPGIELEKWRALQSVREGAERKLKRARQRAIDTMTPEERKALGL